MTGFRNFIIYIAALAASTGIAAAQVVVDQEQPLINEAAGFHGVGGNEEQKLAQTFIVGVDGYMVGLRLPIIGCGRGDLVLELRRQDSGKPTGSILRAVTIPGGDVPFSGVADFLFHAPLAINAGAELAFTVQTVGEDSYCSYAMAPDGDTYPRGESFFESLPNPPGWLSSEDFPGPHDLSFYTLMDDPSGPGASAGAGNCVIPGEIDPATGMPLILPIINDVPACRCFEDASAREFRCGILHPDFFILRRLPFPLTLGKPFEEVWQFTPLTKLDGPVRITLTGGAFEKPVEFEFAAKRKQSSYRKQSFRRRFTAKAAAPLKSVTLPGAAIIEYEMKDADNEYLMKFGLDTTIEESQFGQ